MSRPVIAWLAVAVVVLVTAFITGRSLNGSGTGTAAFELDSPAFAEASRSAGFSKAGFSGFSEASADGRTVISGRVVEVSATSITLEDASGQRSAIQLGAASNLTRLESANRAALRPGVTVLVRRDASDDSAAAVLILAEP